KDVRPERRCNTEGNTHLHAAGIRAEWLIKVSSDLGEILNGGKQFADQALRQTHQPGSVHGVLAAGQFMGENKAEFEQSRNPSINRNSALGGTCRTGDHLQDRAFSGTVLTDNAQRLTTIDAEADVPNGPMLS